MIRRGLSPLLKRVAASSSSAAAAAAGATTTTTTTTPRLAHDGLPLVHHQPQYHLHQYDYRRTYRGDSGDAIRTLDDAEEELLRIAQPKADAMTERYIQLPTEDENDKAQQVVRRKRLIYRSKQRGWLEVDLLLGMWASENVPQLSDEELNEFESFVNLETIDIYNVITLRMDVPENMKHTDGTKSVVQQIQDWARSNPLGKADKEGYRTAKTDANLI